jgi:uncharacterized protein (TIGR00251 family)
MLVKIRVIPRSKRVEVKEINAESLRVRLHSPPIDGRANNELIAILGKYYDKPRSAIHIRKGLRSRDKVVEIKD